MHVHMTPSVRMKYATLLLEGNLTEEVVKLLERGYTDRELAGKVRLAVELIHLEASPNAHLAGYRTVPLATSRKTKDQPK